MPLSGTSEVRWISLTSSLVKADDGCFGDGVLARLLFNLLT